MTPTHGSSGPDDTPATPTEFDPSDPKWWPAPPEPREQDWERVRSAIADRLPGRRPWWPVAAVTLGLSVVVGFVGWWTWPSVAPKPEAPEVKTPPATQPEDPLAGYDDLPVATADDVMISVVRGEGVRFGSLDHPVPETMPLATAADVIVHRGPAAGELSCPAPGDAAVYLVPGEK